MLWIEHDSIGARLKTLKLNTDCIPIARLSNCLAKFIPPLPGIVENCHLNIVSFKGAITFVYLAVIIQIQSDDDFLLLIDIETPLFDQDTVFVLRVMLK